MKNLIHFLTRFSLLLLLLLPGSSRPESLAQAANRAPQAVQPTDYGKMALVFTKNQGQFDPQVSFTVQGGDRSIYFTGAGLTFSLSQKVTTAQGARHMPNVAPARFQVEPATAPVERWALKLDFVGARLVRPVGLGQTGTTVSYFRGRPTDWRITAPTFSRILYPDLWSGIDLVYSGTYDRLNYDFTLRPGADPSQIKLAYHSASAVRLDESGRLQVSTPLGTLQDDAPAAYQEIDGKKMSVAVVYNLEGDTYAFNLGAYDPAYSLVIDPAVLVYAGFIGGSGFDFGSSIAVDDSGAAYITGGTGSTDFPVLGGPALSYNGGSFDAFVAKIKPDGSSLVYASYLGGSGYDIASGIAVDQDGSAYVTGYSNSPDFPVPGEPDPNFKAGLDDAFVAKLTPDGSNLVYSTFIGGRGNDTGGLCIALDQNNAAYVTGWVGSANFPALVGPGLTFKGAYTDVLVAKVKPDGSGLDYAGFVGGSNEDHGISIAVDRDGAAYVTGYTQSHDFPTLGSLGLNFKGGDFDAFVVKVKPDGSGLVYSGYLGGSDQDYGYGIAVDWNGAAYIVGSTHSVDFPTLIGPSLSYHGGFSDAFVAKVRPDGNELVYAGFLGGNGADDGNDIAVDDQGSAYITGRTYSADFPIINWPAVTLGGRIMDVFAAKIRPDGSGLVYSGNFGGVNEDEGLGIAIDHEGAAYITGYTLSPDFPTKVGPFLTYHEGNYDGFVAKINPQPLTFNQFLPVLLH